MSDKKDTTKQNKGEKSASGNKPNGKQDSKTSQGQEGAKKPSGR
jgi:hypothetical protein